MLTTKDQKKAAVLSYVKIIAQSVCDAMHNPEAREAMPCTCGLMVLSNDEAVWLPMSQQPPMCPACEIRDLAARLRAATNKLLAETEPVG